MNLQMFFDDRRKSHLLSIQSSLSKIEGNNHKHMSQSDCLLKASTILKAITEDKNLLDLVRLSLRK